MSNKKEKKSAAKNTKKTPENKTILMLKLDNGVEVPAKITYMKDNTKCLKINDIAINKIRVSEKKLYNKKQCIQILCVLLA